MCHVPFVFFVICIPQKAPVVCCYDAFNGVVESVAGVVVSVGDVARWVIVCQLRTAGRLEAVALLSVKSTENSVKWPIRHVRRSTGQKQTWVIGLILDILYIFTRDELVYHISFEQEMILGT